MSLYLIRHGETEWTIERRHTGRTDIPLTEPGREQARQLHSRLEGITFSRVLTSPMRRAQVTAELAGISPAAEIALRLQEFDYGEYEGLTSAAIRQRRPGWDLWRDGCPGGESAEEVVARGRQLLEELSPQPGRDYALFGHGHALRALAAAYLGMNGELCRHLQLGVASISILGLDRDLPVIEAWNLTAGVRRRS